MLKCSITTSTLLQQVVFFASLLGTQRDSVVTGSSNRTACFICFALVGVGKTHKDAASVRATHPIPASCGVYYFEVRIISKGRDGYVSHFFKKATSSCLFSRAVCQERSDLSSHYSIGM